MTFWLPVSLVSALCLQAPSLESRPQFSGLWQLDLTRSESAAATGGREPVMVEIAQSDRDVAIVTTRNGRESRTVHGIVAGPGNQYAIDGAGRAYWNGNALVTEGTRLVQGQTVATRETRTLNADGSEMTVEVIVIVQHGYQFRGARNYGIGRDVYVRTAR